MNYFTINTTVTNVYKEPAHNSAVVTQALMGESYPILDKKDDWYRIKQWDGYEGWVYYFYGIESKERYEPTSTLQDMFGTIITPDKEKMVCPILFGTQLKVEGDLGEFKVTLPDGRQGFAYSNFGELPKQINRNEIVNTASRFIGVPYVWGGKTPYGIDCSGLVQTVFKANGIELPRDAYQQAEHFAEQKININDIEKGDLLFFGPNEAKIEHVAISTGGMRFIHSQGWVKRQSIDGKRSDFNSKLLDSYLFAVSIKDVIVEW